MPPLERQKFSPYDTQEIFVSIHDNRVYSGKHEKADVFSMAPLPSKSSRIGYYAVLAQRDVIVGTNPLYEFNLTQTTSEEQPRNCQAHGMDLWDIFTGLCVTRVGGGRGNRGSRSSKRWQQSQPQPSDTFKSVIKPHVLSNSQKKVAVASKKKIVYPIARYPARLNSPYLVEKRRESLRKHLTFQPVPERG